MRKYHQKPTTHLGKMSINVLNLDRSLAFYEQVIGYQLLEKTKRQAILTVDGKNPTLILKSPEGVIPKKRLTTGLYHFAILLPKRNDLANFLRHLLTLNIPFGASDHAVSEAIYLDDPDGNGIEVYCDRPDAHWERVTDGIHMTTDRLDGDNLLQEADAKWTILPENTVMGHIHLHVAHLADTEKFYSQGLDFDLMTRYPGALFMSSGGYHHHLGLNIWNGEGAPAPAEGSVGLNWFTLVIENEAKRERLKQNLDTIGATVKEHDGNYMTKDPSGNVIRLVI